MNDAKIDVTGMPEFDALLDYIYEYGTASEGTIDHANTFARAIIAQARAELIADLELMAYAASDPERRNQLMSKAQYDSALPKNRVKFDTPLYALPNKERT